MSNEANSLSADSRRQFLKATALGVAGAALGVRPGLSAPKTMSIMHENSFIKTFDEYFQKTLIPAYEKLTGVKIKYELVSVGGLQTRVTTVAETGTGPDMTLNFFNWRFLYDEKYVDVGDVAEEAGKKNAGWHDAAKEAVIVNGKWKEIPFGNVGQLMNWRTDWFKEAGYDKFPDTWEEPSGGRHQAEGQWAPLWL
jgi:multiple sugar transport system substrate-binding protein